MLFANEANSKQISILKTNSEKATNKLELPQNRGAFGGNRKSLVASCKRKLQPNSVRLPISELTSRGLVQSARGKNAQLARELRNEQAAKELTASAGALQLLCSSRVFLRSSLQASMAQQFAFQFAQVAISAPKERLQRALQAQFFTSKSETKTKTANANSARKTQNAN